MDNVVISGKDRLINYQGWVDGYINVLCIIGYSGSGKSTLGTKLKNKYDCHLIDLDSYRDNWIKNYILKNLKYLTSDDIRYIELYIHSTWELTKYFKYVDYDNKYKDYYNVVNVLWNQELVRLILHSNKRIILEGIWISLLNDVKIDHIKSKISCIIMDTSVIKSVYRSMARNMQSSSIFTLWDYIHFGINEIRNQYTLVKFLVKAINDFKIIMTK